MFTFPCRFISVVGLVSLVGFSPVIALAAEPVAQPSADADLAIARKAFHDAKAFMETKDFSAAAVQLQKAISIRETPGLYFNLGLCFTELERYRDALRAFDDAARIARDKPQKDVEDLLPEARARADRLLPSIELTGAPGNVNFWIDGTAIDSRLVRVDPGEHRIEGRCDGYEPFVVSVKLRPGALEKVEVVMRPKSPVLESRRQNSAVESHWGTGKSVVFWSSAAVGVVGATIGTLGVVQSVDAQSRYEAAAEDVEELAGDSNSACVNPSGALETACSELAQANGSRGSGATQTWVGVGLLGAGILGAVGTVRFWPNEEVKVGASVGPGTFSVRLHGAF